MLKSDIQAENKKLREDVEQFKKDKIIQVDHIENLDSAILNLQKEKQKLIDALKYNGYYKQKEIGELLKN